MSGSKAFAKEAKRIIRGVLRFKDAAPFTRMKDDAKIRAPYLKENPNPIFLRDVWEKLGKGEYAHFGEVDADMQRLWAQEDRYRNSCSKFDSEASKRFRQYQAVKNYYQIMAAPQLKKKLAEPTPPQHFRRTTAVTSTVTTSSAGGGRKTVTRTQREVLDLTSSPASAPPTAQKKKQLKQQTHKEKEVVVVDDDDAPDMPLAKPQPKAKPKPKRKLPSLSAAALADEVKEALKEGPGQEQEGEDEDEDDDGTLSEEAKPIDPRNTGTGAERSFGLKVHVTAPSDDEEDQQEEDVKNQEREGEDREDRRAVRDVGELLSVSPDPRLRRRREGGGGGGATARGLGTGPRPSSGHALSTGTRTARRKAKLLAAVRQETESRRRQSYPKTYKSPIRSAKRNLHKSWADEEGSGDGGGEGGGARLFEPPPKRRRVFVVRITETDDAGDTAERVVCEFAHSMGEVLNEFSKREGVKVISVTRSNT